ncbi:hypothetical protein [Cupriavidus necator]
MARVSKFIREQYRYQFNPYPSQAVLQYGSADRRENGDLFNKNVESAAYEEAVDKFIVRPIDSGSKFHFLWSLGEGDGARGFGKSALLRCLVHDVNHDLGQSLLASHGFDENEVANMPILAALGSFDTTSTQTLAAVCLQHAWSIALHDERLNKSALHILRAKVLRRLARGSDSGDANALANAIRNLVEETFLAIGGKMLGSPDRQLVNMFADGDWRRLAAYVRDATARDGFELLNTIFVLARAGGIKRVFLFTDQVEDFANADISKKRRHMEVERFRDLSIEAQPFGEMSAYVLTMHPEAARQIEGFWSEARLPALDPLAPRTRRTAVILRPVKSREDAMQIYHNYSNDARIPDSDVAPLHPLDDGALDVLVEVAGGRPGEMLKLAHDLIEVGAQDGCRTITGKEARDILAEAGPVIEEEKAVRRARGIGLVG